MIRMGQVSSCLRSAGGAFGTLWGCAPDKAVTGRSGYRPLRTKAAYSYTQGDLMNCSPTGPRDDELSIPVGIFTRLAFYAVDTYDVPTSRLTKQLTSVLNARDLAEACRSIAPGDPPLITCPFHVMQIMLEAHHSCCMLCQCFSSEHADRDSSVLAGRLIRSACPVDASEEDVLIIREMLQVNRLVRHRQSKL